MCLCRWRLSARKRAERNRVRRELCLYTPACSPPPPNRLASEETPGWAAQDQEPGACSHRGWLCEACRDRLPGHPRGPQELMVRTRAHGVASGPGPCSATLPASSVDEGKTANLSETQCFHVNGVGTPAPASRARWVGGQDRVILLWEVGAPFWAACCIPSGKDNRGRPCPPPSHRLAH